MEVDCSHLTVYALVGISFGHHDWNKGLSLQFLEGYQVWQKAPEKGRRLQWLKSEYSNNQDEYRSPQCVDNNQEHCWLKYNMGGRFTQGVVAKVTLNFSHTIITFTFRLILLEKICNLLSLSVKQYYYYCPTRMALAVNNLWELICR